MKVLVFETGGLLEKPLGGLGEVVEDEVEELFPFLRCSEVWVAGVAFLGALVHVSAHKHAV